MVQNSVHKWKGMESPGMVKGEEAQNMYSDTAKLVALVMKALENFLVVSVSSIN